MNLFAFDEEKRVIYAGQADRDKEYRCRECHGIVRCRRGSRRQPHFYHVQSERGCHQGGKSLEHLQVQLYIKDHLPHGEAEIEWPFEAIGRIADVAWLREKVVFEIQCSDITHEEVLARNSDYAKAGYEVVWIFHDDRYNKPMVHPAEDALAGKSFYYTDMDFEGKGRIYDQMSFVEEGMRVWTWQEYSVDVSGPRREVTRAALPKTLLPRKDLYFADDVVDRCLADNDMAAALCQQEREFLRRSRRRRCFRWLLLVKGHVVRFYLSLFRLQLEKACR